MRHYGLKETVATGDDLFVQVRDKLKHFNYETTYNHIIEDFREGKLGRITMDVIDFWKKRDSETIKRTLYKWRRLKEGNETIPTMGNDIQSRHQSCKKGNIPYFLIRYIQG